MNRYAAGRILALSACMLSACTVGPNFKAPPPPPDQRYEPEQAETPPPAGANREHVTIGEAIPAEWWALFGSASLDDTLRLALQANKTLAAARATLAAAQEAIVEARGAALPQVNASAGVNRFGAGGPHGGSSTSYSAGLEGSFALDPFGLIRRQIEQTRATAEEQRYQLASAYLTLTSDVVSEAITIASARIRITTTEQLIKDDAQNLDLVQREFEIGKAAQGDVLTAKTQLTGDQTQLPPLHQQLSEAQHALAILVGRTPAQWTPPTFAVEDFTLPRNLPVSLPSELVHQRPDILVAESQLHAASAAVGVATAELYPAISLSAGLTQQAIAAGTLFDASSRAWSLGAGLAQPLFHGGALQAARRAAIDTLTAQRASYEGTVLQAFDQVADALRAITNDTDLVEASRIALETADASRALTRGSYDVGKSNVLQLLDAERSDAQARLTYVSAQVQQLQDGAQLLVASGGGWWQMNGRFDGPSANAGN